MKITNWLSKCTQSLQRLPTGGYLLIFIGINIALSLPYLQSPLVADPDAYGRVLQAWLPMQSGHFWDIRLDSQWLPLHGLILRMGWLVWKDFFHTPQYLTFLISLSGIPLFFIYCRKALTRGESLIATFLYTVFPLRYILSTQPLTESMLLPFILLPLIAIVDRGRKWIIGGLCGLAVAGGIRYDAWYLLPFIWIDVVNRIHNPYLRFGGVAASLLTPAIWILSSYLSTHQWLMFLSQRINVAGPTMQTFIYRPIASAVAVGISLLRVIPLPLIILIIIGLIHLLTKKEKDSRITHYMFALIPLYFLAFFYAMVFSGTMEWITSRFFLLIAVLFIPSVIVGAREAYRISKTSLLLLLISFTFTIPSYVTAQRTLHTYFALLGDAPQEKYAAAQEIIRYINANTTYRFRYVVPEDKNPDFVTMVSYFTKTDMFITAYTPPEVTGGTTYFVIEKDDQTSNPAQPNSVIDNEFFSVFLQASK